MSSTVSMDLVGVAVFASAEALLGVTSLGVTLLGVGADTGSGAGVEDRDFTDKSMGSVVRRPRSLMVSFCGFAFCSASGSSGQDC